MERKWRKTGLAHNNHFLKSRVGLTTKPTDMVHIKILREEAVKATRVYEYADRLSDLNSLMFQYFSKMNTLGGLEVECQWKSSEKKLITIRANSS